MCAVSRLPFPFPKVDWIFSLFPNHFLYVGQMIKLPSHPVIQKGIARTKRIENLWRKLANHTVFPYAQTNNRSKWNLCLSFPIWCVCVCGSFPFRSPTRITHSINCSNFLVRRPVHHHHPSSPPLLGSFHCALNGLGGCVFNALAVPLLRNDIPSKQGRERERKREDDGDRKQRERRAPRRARTRKSITKLTSFTTKA